MFFSCGCFAKFCMQTLSKKKRQSWSFLDWRLNVFGLFCLWVNEFVTLAMHIDNFYLRIIAQMFTQFSDVNIH